MPRKVGRNELCPCGSGRKFKRCCLETSTHLLREIASAPSWSPVQAALTLLVETPDGVMARSVPHASPLDRGTAHGYAAEIATHDAAAVWGLPDFVFRPSTQRVGSGNRELGDGILVVGDLAAVVQVKSRETPSGDPDKERRWLTKKAKQAVSQGRGTIRRLRCAPVELENLRGTTVCVDAHEHEWLVVVVLDHATPQQAVTPELPTDQKTVILLRQDWEFLFDQLKSTHAVIRYLGRVAGEPLELGSEPKRYYEFALADLAAPPEVLDPALVGPGETVSSPVLPLAPAALEDFEAHQLVRTIYEDFAVTRLRSITERERLRVLAELDRIPVGDRARVGRFLMSAMAAVRANDEGVLWSLRSIRGSAGQAHLAYGACSHVYDENIQDGFRLWVQLRHHDVISVTGDIEGLTTVAVLLTPGLHAGRPWDTSVIAVSGDMRFTGDELRDLRELWPSRAAT